MKRRAYDPGSRGRRAVLSRATRPKTTQTWNLLGFRVYGCRCADALERFFCHVQPSTYLHPLDPGPGFSVGGLRGVGDPLRPQVSQSKKGAKENSIKEDEGPEARMQGNEGPKGKNER